jgi:hypothetical protein
MIKNRLLTTNLAIACLLLSGVLTISGCKSKESEAAMLAGQKAADYVAIENVMALHFWYHAAMMNDVEIEKCWSHRDDNVWAQNGGFWKGSALIKKNYGQHVDPATTKGMGAWHPQNSAVIEIAQDRQTAKGIWYTVGVVGGYNGTKQNASWMFEKYGVDFVNENGQWKIWHMHIYTDFGAPLTAGSSMGGPGGPGGAPQKAEKVGKESKGNDKNAAPPQMGSPFDPKQDTYKEWGPDTIPRLVPRPPEPYKTFSETFSYVDENEWANANK